MSTRNRVGLAVRIGKSVVGRIYVEKQSRYVHCTPLCIAIVRLASQPSW
ncbi:hypothetical protein PLANPX_3046 [Lacipirellula parvula]|uniref:Uncharacterized protein n=1 Tax=Lacipirellula parvula TaxID=2650471 RepID=A0A5K7X9M9_9BACT|nr:hypothetical protein PLANPX_3046 [Lacipirellula parvula]